MPLTVSYFRSRRFSGLFSTSSAVLVSGALVNVGAALVSGVCMGLLGFSLVSQAKAAPLPSSPSNQAFVRATATAGATIVAPLAWQSDPARVGEQSIVNGTAILIHQDKRACSSDPRRQCITAIAE